MQYFKSFIFSVFMIASTIIVATLALILFLLPFKTRFAVIRTFAVMNVFLLKHLCGLDYEIEGQENIPEGAGIIFSKHQSTWETMALQLIFPPQTFVLKKELMWVPFFGWGLAVMKPIAINRGAGRNAIKQIVSQGIDRLKAGIWIVIFPEGTIKVVIGPCIHTRDRKPDDILTEAETWIETTMAQISPTPQHNHN